MRCDLRGKVAFVTGAAGTIGRAIAQRLCDNGASVVIADVNLAGAEALAATLPSALAVAVDISSADSAEAGIAATLARFGRLDILVNNAGIFDFADAAPSTASIPAVRKVLETNFIGALAVTQAMLPLLRKSRAARIVNLSSSLGSLSVNSDPTSPYFAQRYIGYNASKAALNMLTIQLTEELRDTGIVVNSVSPGFVKTDLTGYGVMTAGEGARLPVKHALGGEDNGRFIEPDGYTPW